MRVLVDMDGVLADFEGAFLDLWRAAHPEHPFVPLPERRSFYVEKEYPDHLLHLVREIFCSANFFRDLPPIPGGLEAVREMERDGIEVFLCTSPLREYQHCVVEKFDWVVRHLGAEWSQRLVLTKDKTIVAGDLLIDDRPSIHGIATPAWEHVLYDQPYNRHVTDKRRLTWENWREVLGMDGPVAPDQPAV